MPNKETIAELSQYVQKFRSVLPDETQQAAVGGAIRVMRDLRSMLPGADEQTLGNAAYATSRLLANALETSLREVADALEVSLTAYCLASAAFHDVIDLSKPVGTPAAEPDAPPSAARSEATLYL